MELENKKLSMDEFLKTREEVLKTWSTGSQVQDLEANIEYAHSIPKTKNFALKLKKAKHDQITLTQPRAGVALISSHIELLKFLSEEGEADLLPTTIDSYTRQNRYENCELGI